MNWDAAKDAALLALGLYGAGLSSLNWWNASQRDKRRVLVRVNTVFTTYTNGSIGAPFARVEAVNVGHREVTIASISFEIDGKHLVPFTRDAFPAMPDTSLPAALKDGGTAHLIMAYADIAQALLDIGQRTKTIIIPFCRDSIGTTYRGDDWEFDPTAFSASARQ